MSSAIDTMLLRSLEADRDAKRDIYTLLRDWLTGIYYLVRCIEPASISQKATGVTKGISVSLLLASSDAKWEDHSAPRQLPSGSQQPVWPRMVSLE